MRIVSLLAAGLLLAACQSAPVEPPEGARVCDKPDMPPEKVACPMIYNPVCGLDAVGTQVGTYGNSCQGCAQPGVMFYRPGRCEDQTL